MRALIFDLDGTLVDTVYGHVIAWQKSFAAEEQKSFAAEEMIVPAWSIHSKIGLDGKQLAINAALELGTTISADQVEALDQRHLAIMKELMPHPQPLPGAAALLRRLRKMKVPFGIATSGGRKDVEEPLKRLGLPADTVVVCKSEVKHAKPDPDLILACRERLDVPARDCFVVGDAIWDMLAARRSEMLGVGVLTGGSGEAELTRAGAYRVYRDPAELDARLYELGFQNS